MSNQTDDVVSKCNKCASEDKMVSRKGLCSSCYRNTHPEWSSYKSNYPKVHYWIKKEHGRATRCEFCQSSKAEWANISGNYEYDIKDWKQLCRPCHRLFDRYSSRMALSMSSFDGMRLAVFPTAHHAYLATNIPSAQICNSINDGNHKSMAGFIWRYIKV